MSKRILFAAIGLLQWLSPALVLAHKDDYLGDTFVFLTLGRRELELEYWIDVRFDPRGGLHTFGAEYGLTDHLMFDASGRMFQQSGGPFTFEQGFLEIRYRFGEENRHLVDLAASAEFEVRRVSENHVTYHLLEPRLILSRDIKGWNFTVNLFYAYVLDAPERSAVEASGGIRAPNFGRWNAGLEFRRELALENESLVIPQIWYRISPEAYLKAGAGKNLAGEKKSFVRIAIEVEF